jgi:nitroreductase
MNMQQDTHSSLIQQATDHVVELYNLFHKTSLVYHSYQRVSTLLEIGKEIAEEEGRTTEEEEVILLALLFADAGFLSDYTDPVGKSEKEAESFLKEVGYPEEKRKKVLQCLQRVLPEDGRPQTKAEKVVMDTLTAYACGEHYAERVPLLMLEKELLSGYRSAKLEWYKHQLQEMLNTRYYTAAAKQRYEPALAQNVVYLRDQVARANKEQLKRSFTPSRFQNLEMKVPERGIQTFFRSNFRNHIHLSAIADNKANIMISVNAILISVLISILTYQNITETNPKVLLPVVLFLITGLTSLIFAVLSIRPKVTSHINPNMPPETIRQHITFFGNFVRLEVEQFEEAMDSLFRNGEYLYQAMTRDLYYLGKVLDKKYRYLTISYNIFMVGFVATVISFLIMLFT